MSYSQRIFVGINHSFLRKLQGTALAASILLSHPISRKYGCYFCLASAKAGLSKQVLLATAYAGKLNAVYGALFERIASNLARDRLDTVADKYKS
jgi:hypothetical protein